jgi:DNA-binding SARP family transcriptional activator
VVEFGILGQLEAVEDGTPLELAGRRPRALLAMLLLRANEVVSVDRLIDGLWDDDPPETARKAVQVYVVQLRRMLPGLPLVTRGAGYVLQLSPGQLDLTRFERLVESARHAEPAVAAERLREALALWRGPPLCDFAYDSFAQPEIARLEELRLAAFEARVDAELELGRDAELVAELEALCREHPLRERVRAQLMLALYRAGRQSDALATYREARRLLDGELGLDPSGALQELERAILRQDPSLAPTTAHVGSERSVLVAPSTPARLDALLELVEPLARAHPPREVIAAVVVEQASLGAATTSLRAHRDAVAARGTSIRVAAFASRAPARDVVRLARDHEADLLVADGLAWADDDALLSVSCDVALVLAPPVDGPILVPFGAAEHDWAALELGAWFARATGAPLRIVGALGGPRDGLADASRMLADVSLILQRVAGIVAEPWLAEPGLAGLAGAAQDAGLLVVGLSERFASEGLGALRTALADSPPAPLVFVRRGPRPGGLAPPESLTRYAWSLDGAA